MTAGEAITMHDSEAIRTLVDFVEGRLSASKFEAQLAADPRLEAALGDDPERPANSYVGRSMFQYVLEQDFGELGGRLNAQGAVSDWLGRHGVQCTPDGSVAKLYDTLLAAQPTWLSIDTKYLEAAFLSRSEGREGRELESWLREQILRSFRFVKAAPDWIQNPEWPIGPAGPLVFLGQLPIDRYFHDTAAAYVFHDPSTGDCTTIVQVA